MPHSTRVVITISMFTAVVWISALVAAGTAEPILDSGARAIAALNDCIQERFKDVDKGFGFRRIVSPSDTPHRFQPENVREMEAVRELVKADLQVVLYLAGRRALQPQPPMIADPMIANVDTSRWAAIKGPVVISAGGTAPRAVDLLNEARRALLMFKNRDSHEFEVDDWKFTVRPVRASDETCLHCHAERSATRIPGASPDKSLRIGDPLGAVLYGIRPAR